MERKDAIKLIYTLARQRGWSNEILHAKIEELDLKDFPSIAIMSPRQLAVIIKKLFGKTVFIKDTKLVWMLRKYCEKNNIPFKIVETLIRHIWKNNDKIYSVYHLNNRQIFALKNKILEYIKQKNEKNKKELEECVRENKKVVDDNRTYNKI